MKGTRTPSAYYYLVCHFVTLVVYQTQLVA